MTNLEGETNCQIINIRKRLRCVRLKTSNVIPTGMLHIKTKNFVVHKEVSEMRVEISTKICDNNNNLPYIIPLV